MPGEMHLAAGQEPVAVGVCRIPSEKLNDYAIPRLLQAFVKMAVVRVLSLLSL